MAAAESPVTLPDFARWKKQGRKISVLTAYDFPTARLLDERRKADPDGRLPSIPRLQEVYLADRPQRQLVDDKESR